MKLTTLDKSLQIIELLSKNPQGLSLLEMSNMLGFPKSTIHHILAVFLLPFSSFSKLPKEINPGNKRLSTCPNRIRWLITSMPVGGLH
jgi:hypothetical protein